MCALPQDLEGEYDDDRFLSVADFYARLRDAIAAHDEAVLNDLIDNWRVGNDGVFRFRGPER